MRLDTAPSASGREAAQAPSSPLAAWLPLAAIVLLAGLLRFPTLATQSIWFDEAATWELTRLPFGEMLSELPHRESNPPLFYVLEWLWTRPFGDGEAGLRSLSALVGTLTVPIAYGIGRRVGGRRAAVATALLVAVNPLLVWFSQEARSYALVVFLAAASLLLFLQALDDPRPRLIACWAVVAALALCAHYFAFFVLLPQAGWLLLRHPRRRAVAAACGALVLVACALLPLLLAQRDNPYDIASASYAVRLLQLPKQFLLGYRGPLALPTAVLGAALSASAIWLLWRQATPPTRRRALLVGAIGVVGILLPAAAAVVGSDYVNARNLLPALVPLAALLGAGFGVARTPRAGVVASALLALLCTLSVAIVLAVASDPEYQRPDWRGLARALGSSSEDRIVVVSPANGASALRFYRRDMRTLPESGARVRAVETVGATTSDGVGGRPEAPEQWGTIFPPELAALRLVDSVRTPQYAMLRWRQPTAGLIVPFPVSLIRFSVLPPSVNVLPADR